MYLIFLTACNEGFNTKISKKRIDELEVGNEKMVGLSYINKEKELIINNYQYFLGRCAEPPFLDIYALKDTLSKYNLTLEKVKVISDILLKHQTERAFIHQNFTLFHINSFNGDYKGMLYIKTGFRIEEIIKIIKKKMSVSRFEEIDYNIFEIYGKY